MGGFKSRLVGAGLAALFAPVALGSAFAQQASSPAIVIVPEVAGIDPQSGMAVPEAYLPAGDRLSDAVINEWLAAPSSLFADNPRGGGDMTQYVALLAGSDERTVPLLIELALSEEPTPLQMRAIAFGLASAAIRSSPTAPEYAAWISTLVAASGLDAFMNAYAMALNFDEAQIETAEIPGMPSRAQSPGGLTGPGGIGPVGAVGTVATQSGDFSARGFRSFGGVNYGGSDPSSAGS